ncbi:MAG TPA: LuxR C-terminal-related transcriptional regulator, partial [Candidatus Limnocylindrales bacterium]|nr:LuxR C-terminal-related transcriptional regulator [Candidatus Limnocylindrales bacterium]
IGERLFISQKTVGVHVGNILAKLGVGGRVEAAMIAVRLELIPSTAGTPRAPVGIGPGPASGHPSPRATARASAS